jgi:hypothetical protein
LPKSGGYPSLSIVGKLIEERGIDIIIVVTKRHRASQFSPESRGTLAACVNAPKMNKSCAACNSQQSDGFTQCLPPPQPEIAKKQIRIGF